MTTPGNWWQPYDAAAERGVVAGTWSREDENPAALDALIDDALRADAANWFAKDGVR